MEEAPQRAQRCVELGGQQQDDQARAQGQAAADQPDADGHGDQRGAEGRRQVEHRAGQERQAQHLHRAAPVLLPALGDEPGLGVRAVVGPQRGEAADDVEHVVGQARERRPPLRARSPAVLPTSARKTGITGSVTSMIAADGGSTTSAVARTATGTVTDSTTCGR